MNIGINNFVRRQIEGSGKTYSLSLGFEEITSHAEIQLTKGKYYQGYRDGVIVVIADESLNKDFICPFVKINENTHLKSRVVYRRVGEEAYIQTVALNGVPSETGRVELIIYRHDVLAENNEHTTKKDWELISINAIPKGLKKLPMGPVTMMRNQLNLKGGTKAEYSTEEWANSVRFWQKYATLST